MSQQFILPTDKNRERIQGNLIAFIDTATFATLYEFIQRRMAEQGIYVPDPEQEVPDAM